ncbi:hypothetical protein VP01_1694g2 [Puccinia sorghi]|uniref:Uncharacterized protein n=1 Tax=Puccinia sorghi TaxID=27349 RepID=A0A0L6VGC6_9BASI|nr:hypothetical protein VP01_1694g2 [Puccinia sorghi]
MKGVGLKDMRWTNLGSHMWATTSRAVAARRGLFICLLVCICMYVCGCGFYGFRGFIFACSRIQGRGEEGPLQQKGRKERFFSRGRSEGKIRGYCNKTASRGTTDVEQSEHKKKKTVQLETIAGSSPNPKHQRNFQSLHLGLGVCGSHPHHPFSKLTLTANVKRFALKGNHESELEDAPVFQTITIRSTGNFAVFKKPYPPLNVNLSCGLPSGVTDGVRTKISITVPLNGAVAQLTSVLSNSIINLLEIPACSITTSTHQVMRLYSESSTDTFLIAIFLRKKLETCTQGNDTPRPPYSTSTGSLCALLHRLGRTLTWNSWGRTRWLCATSAGPVPVPVPMRNPREPSSSRPHEDPHARHNGKGSNHVALSSAFPLISRRGHVNDRADGEHIVGTRAMRREK